MSPVLGAVPFITYMAAAQRTAHHSNSGRQVPDGRIVCIAVVVLVIYVVRFLKSLMVTLEHTNEVLKDVEVITDIAAKRSEDVDSIISDVADTVSDITETINGKQNIISTAAAIAKAVISVRNTAEKDK